MGRWKEGRRDGPDGWEYGNTFVNPFGGAVASFDVHGLALGRAVGVGAQRVGNLTGQLHLLFHRRVESRIEAGRRVHPTFYITKTYLKPPINLRLIFLTSSRSQISRKIRRRCKNLLQVDGPASFRAYGSSVVVPFLRKKKENKRINETNESESRARRDWSPSKDRSSRR